MNTASFPALRRSLVIATPLALALLLPACGSNNSDDNGPPVVVAPTPTPTPTPSPSPTPTPSPVSRNVTACLNQVIPGTNGATPATLVLPDTIKLNFGVASGFPNGRRPQRSRG